MMYLKSFGIVLLLLGISIVLCPKFEALAQEDYPNRPIEIVVPYAPGGPIDLGAGFFLINGQNF